MKRFLKVFPLLFCVIAIFAINPAWPIWGQTYVADPDLTINSSSLVSFLQNAHYDGFQKFSSVFALACLYLATLTMIALLWFNVFEAKRFLVIEFIVGGLLVIATLLFLFTNYFEPSMFTLTAFIPFVGSLFIGLDILLERLEKKEENQ